MTVMEYGRAHCSSKKFITVTRYQITANVVYENGGCMYVSWRKTRHFFTSFNWNENARNHWPQMNKIGELIKPNLKILFIFSVILSVIWSEWSECGFEQQFCFIFLIHCLLFARKHSNMMLANRNIIYKYYFCLFVLLFVHMTLASRNGNFNVRPEFLLCASEFLIKV